MSMKKTSLLVIVFFYLLSSNAQSVAPSVINSSGGSFQSGYYQFEWSVGELALINEMSSAGNTHFITNGFLQSFTQYPEKNNTSNIFHNDEIKIFPNPASSYVEINFFTKQQGRITLSFYDGAGKKVYSVTDQYYGNGLIKRIPVSQLPNEVYMLHIELSANAGFISKKGIYKVIKIK